MEKRELRIGNIVTDEFYDTFKKLIVVESVGEKGINVYADDDGKPYGMHKAILDYECEYEQLRGVPLDEEWLFRLGFRLDEKTTYWTYAWGFQVICMADNKTMVFAHNEIPNRHLAKVEYVHQLQNIYFALTTQELTLLPSNLAIDKNK